LAIFFENVFRLGDIGLRYGLSLQDEPVVYVKPGETLELEVEEAFSGQIRKKGDRRDRVEVQGEILLLARSMLKVQRREALCLSL